ncbi:MAG: hypothetical protein Q7S22_05260 [Candidatus Micrarchaeota archaeon]|nr:hypothetical protein [Candidatus Micrarchaeota archaeon]
MIELTFVSGKTISWFKNSSSLTELTGKFKLGRTFDITKELDQDLASTIF